MLIPTKEDMLNHYGRLEKPQVFIQFDTFYDAEDGRGLSNNAGVAYELMSGLYNVRILIRPDTTKDIAIKALRTVKWEGHLAVPNQNRKILFFAFVSSQLLSKNGFTLDEVKTMLGDCLGDCIPF